MHTDNLISKRFMQAFKALSELLRRARLNAWLTIPSFIIFLFISREYIRLLQDFYRVNLIFYDVLEPITVLIKSSFYLTILVLLPVLIRCLLNASLEILEIEGKRLDLLSIILYLGGLIFCATITIPFGLHFLLGFESTTLKPMISVTNFVDFTHLLLIVFGILFQLPIIILILVKLNVINLTLLKKNRRLAFFIITIISAIITPTTDILNMSLMIIPLTILYELGIIITNMYLKE